MLDVDLELAFVQDLRAESTDSRDRASSNRCMVLTDPCNLFFEFFYKYGENHAMCTMHRDL